MSPLPTGTVTFLFTDIAGSTRLAQEHPETMPDVLARHHAILHHAIVSHHGHVFQIVGDACSAAFATAPDALAAALSAQRALQSPIPQGDRYAASNLQLRVRMGLHTGAAEWRGTEYEGYLTLSRTQRLMSIGHGGQILLSHATQVLVRDQLPPDASLIDLGERRLKDLIQPEHVFQLIIAGLPSDFPPIKTLDSLPNNLPIQLTSFIGREREIGKVKRLLATAHLLTLTGAGGCGKTRLALQVAADVLDAPSTGFIPRGAQSAPQPVQAADAGHGQGFPDGVWLVELASLSDPSLVPQLVASALGVREQPSQPLLAALTHYLRDKHLLLLLDNCEHLIEACAHLCDALLHVCPSLQILATSREALDIAGEMTFLVPSLSSPNPENRPSIESVTQYEAVQLFVARASAVQSHFTLTEKNAPAVAQICYRLDGIPLAIELAAARVKALSVEQIATRLDDVFHLLTGGSRTALPRHQTLRAATDWSYDLLSEPECALFRRLSVFAGGWTLEAAEAVCGDEVGAGFAPAQTRQPQGLPLPQSGVLDLLTQLVNKSLVLAEERSGEARHRMLEPIRQYAREKLLDASEGQALHDRHLEYLVKLGEKAEPELSGREMIAWLDRLEREIDNVRIALDWSKETARFEEGLRLATALLWFWNLRGYQAEGLERLQALLDASAPSKNTLARAYALVAAGNIQWRRGSYSEVYRMAEEALAIGNQFTDRLIIARAHLLLGQAAYSQGRYEMA